MTRRLTVAVDAVAALRERAGGPSLAAVAALADTAGAACVRLGLREEEEPGATRDLRALAAAGIAWELRMPPIPTLLKVAFEARPARVLLASSPNGSASALPLDFRAWGSALAPALRALEEAGIAAGALVAPDLSAVKAAHAVGARGIELYTGALVDLPANERREAFARLSDAARLAGKLRLEIGLGGGLDAVTMAEVLEAVPGAGHVSVGRAWVRRAFLVGIDRATRDLAEAARGASS